MGRDLYDESAAARRVFDQADDTLGMSLSYLIFEGVEAELNDTVNAQPAILTVSIACLAALQERWGSVEHLIRPRALAGHSLGEYTALVAAGALDFDSAVRLVRERGRLMKEAGLKTPGGMAAVIGLDDVVLDRVCALAAGKGIIVPANYNSPGQTVISGELAALAEAMQLAISEGARKVVRLALALDASGVRAIRLRGRTRRAA
jgi:[acyl-carrier-protein] S-malonyltransferase